MTSPHDQAITRADEPSEDWSATPADADRGEAHRRRRVRYFEQVSAAARLQAGGVSMRDLLRVKALVDAGKVTDWPPE